MAFIPKRLRISPRISANASAGIYPLTTNPSTRFPVRSTISQVIKNDINPSVKKLSGAVRKRATQPIIRLIMANTIPTTIAVQSQSTSTPGKSHAVRATAIQEIINSMIRAI
jgi:hypothetical protein